MLASEEWFAENAHGSVDVRIAEREFRKTLATPAHADNPDF
jgi:hypothetical protein